MKVDWAEILRGQAVFGAAGDIDCLPPRTVDHMIQLRGRALSSMGRKSSAICELFQRVMHYDIAYLYLAPD